MLLLILVAFLAGVVTILSPCILPVLPIVLAGSVGEGKRRPLGIITGFVLSFTFFTLFLSTLVKFSGISADSLRLLSIIGIGLFGISLLIPQTQIILERILSPISGNVALKNTHRHGFWGGFLIGLSLGLIWTPCVGPIIASVITLAATSSVSGSAILITLSYSVGTAISMLSIMVGGRALLQKIPVITRNSGRIQKIFGFLLLATALAIAVNFDRTIQTFILEKFPQYGTGLTQIENQQIVRDALTKLNNSQTLDESKTGKPMFEVADSYLTAPELIAGGKWFNSDPTTIAALKGKVILIDFWTYTCINCIRTLPYLRTWHEKYKNEGLVVIGVHTPEFEFEKNSENVAKAIADFKLAYPVMQDNNYATWQAYTNRYWPAKYLIDKNGKIRYTHFGEGDYDETEAKIQELLKETGVSVADIPIFNPTYEVSAMTRETYLGFDRISNFVSPQKVVLNKSTQFSFPTDIPLHHFAYSGEWQLDHERAIPKAGAELVLNFSAKEVYLVMRQNSGEGAVEVFLDDVPATQFGGSDVQNGKVSITTDRLYRLIALPQSGSHRLRLKFTGDGTQLFAFTFG